MKKCFISYPTPHKDHAMFLKKNLEDLYPENIDIFLASDGESVRPGDDWYDSILKNIRGIDYFLVLLPSFHVSQWVMFEAGAAVIQEAKVIPLRYYGLNADFVPRPLMQKQSIDLTNKIEVEELLKRLAFSHIPKYDRLNSYVEKLVKYFSDLGIDDPDLSTETRQVPPLNTRLQSLSVASDIQRKLFFYILKNSGEKGLLESKIREDVPVMYHDYEQNVEAIYTEQVVCPSEYYFRLRELYHLGFLEMKRVSEFENRWSVRSDIKRSLVELNPTLVGNP